jgi:RNA polymerase sigma factor (sigma-70 family)
VTRTRRPEDLLRELAPQVLGALVRRHGQLDLCEDAVQEGLLQASVEWAKSGIPDNPGGWLLTVATRRLIDRARSDTARRHREDRVLIGDPSATTAGVPGEESHINRDDSLVLLFMCCHPALSPPSQIALTLRAVGGLTTAEIAAAFLVPEATMAQRITRAKQTIGGASAVFSLPPQEEVDERARIVRHVLYLVFNEGYTTSAGPGVNRTELTTEAIRLTREVNRLRPEDTETMGLLALMLLTEARRPARTNAEGEVVPLALQDRSLWDQELIREGCALVTSALSRGPLGSYQLQAAIAAVHDEAEHVDDTDWPQVLALYELLDRVSPNPMATLNRAIAVAMVRGTQSGLDLLATLNEDRRVSEHHLFYAVKGHLLDMAGSQDSAREAFEIAARRTTSLPEKRYLYKRSQKVVAHCASPHTSIE